MREAEIFESLQARLEDAELAGRRHRRDVPRLHDTDEARPLLVGGLRDRRAKHHPRTLRVTSAQARRMPAEVARGPVVPHDRELAGPAVDFVGIVELQRALDVLDERIGLRCRVQDAPPCAACT